MRHTGTLFLSRTPPQASTALCGAFQLQLLLLDRLGPHHTEPWRATWTGVAAQRFWQEHHAALLPGAALEVELERNGNVRRLVWLRAPRHAPEVVAEIERTVRAAAPFPAPTRMSGKLSYTDTWLWDKSGRFQLDTLTEGQRSE